MLPVLHAADQEELPRSLTIKVGIIVLALGGALYFGFLRSEAEEQPDTPESAVPYVCLEDGHVFDLTPAAFNEMLKAGTAGAGDDGEGHRGGTMRVRCPQCGKRTAVLGARCPHDQTVFTLEIQDGGGAACPNCNWSPF